jgi:hypothetical protein
MYALLRRKTRFVAVLASAHRLAMACLLCGLDIAANVSPAAADLINDPYVLNFADGASAVAFNVPENTGVPAVFDLSYGSWSFSFIGQDLEVVLTIDPMTG